MDFYLEPLPYEKDDLAPFLGVQTLTTHHEKHHGGYIAQLNDALSEAPLRDQSLTEIMLSSEGKTFNLAAQVWNHNFYWQSLSAREQTPAESNLSRPLVESFGSIDAFKRDFADAAANTFGSGWTWLVMNPDTQRLNVTSTANAMNPLVDGKVPLLTLDVWEHAYYLDYKHDRASYIDAFLDAHVNWSFAEENFVAATQRSPL